MTRAHLRLATLFFGVAAALATLAVPVRGQDPGEVVRLVRGLMVRIVGPGGIRSGFVAAPRGGNVVIVTALVSVGAAENVAVVDINGRAHQAQVVYRSRETGIAAALVSDWTGPRVLDLDPRPLQPGEPVVVIGFDRQSSDFIYMTLRAAGARQLNRPVPPGFVGGPVASLRDQRVVGVVGSPQGMVIPVSAVHLAIASAMAPSPTSRQTPRATPTAVVQAPPTTGPLAAEITIAAYPSGASIAVDGRTLGRAPVRLPPSRFGLGPHKITGAASGRLTLTRTVALPPEGIIDVFLPPAPSMVPASPRGRDALAKLQTAFEESNGAQTTASLQELLTESPAIPEFRVYQAVALWLQGNRTEALTAAKGHINVYGETLKSLDAYILLGILLEEQRQFQDALTGYKLAVKVQPQHAPEFRQPIVATEAGIQSQARQVAGSPSDLPARIRLGLMYEAKGRFKEGMTEFKAVLYATPPAATTTAPAAASQALTIRTFPTQAFIHVGDRLIGQSPISLPGPYPEELHVRVALLGYAEMRRAVRPRGRSDILIVLLPTLEGYGRTRFAIDNMREGLRGFASGDWAAATRHFLEAFDSDYTLIKLRIYIGAGYYMQGRVSESLEALRAYINVRDNDSTAMLAYALMGVIREEQSQHGEALTLYKLALKLHPAMSQTAALPPATTDPEIASLQESVRKAPDDPRLQYRLGVSWELKGRLLEGMLAMRRALFTLGTT